MGTLSVPTSDLRILLMLMMAFAGCLGDDVANPEFFPPVIGDFVPQNCWNFSLGDWKQREFYSPSYPGLYTNNTECIQLLVAPRGFRIRLDFRDEFHIEASDKCKYDFLELRDGPFGYSPLLGKYCGKRHPPMVESSSRFLWVMFKSDESIEYKGFRAVYEFFKPGEEDINRTKNYTRNLIYEVGEDEVCRIEVDISKNDGFMTSEDIPLSYLLRVNTSDMSVDCTWVVYTPPKHRIYLRWKEYEMTTPQQCKDSFLEAYDRTTAYENRRKLFCGGMAKDIKSASNHFYLRLHSANVALIPKFSALFTVFVHGTCPSSMFDCGDNTCVNKSLVCNDQVNCNFSWDEMFCKKSTTATMTEETPVVVQYSTIILGIVGGIIVTIVCLSICITCHQRRREEQRRKSALKQEERNAIEMTTLLTKTPHGSPQRPVDGRPLGGATAAAAASSAPNITANHVMNNNQSMPNHATRSDTIRIPATSHRQIYSQTDATGSTMLPHNATTTPKRQPANQGRYVGQVASDRLKQGHMGRPSGGGTFRTKLQRDSSVTSEYSVNAAMADPFPESGTFKRYLDVCSYSEEDLGRGRSSTSRREIPAAVILERPITTPRRSRPLTASLSEDLELPAPTMIPGSGSPRSARPHTLPRDRSPSPRPDVVQEERLTYEERHPPRDPRFPEYHNPSDPLQQARRYSLETLISEKSDVWKPRSTEADLVLTSRPCARSSDELDRVYYQTEHPRSHHEQPKVTVSPARRRSPKSPHRSDSYKRRKSAGSTNSPDIFYSRPNRAVRKHHPV